MNVEKQLRKDLENRIDERLRTWARDSVDLYLIAGLEPRDAAVDIFTTVTAFIANGVVLMEIPEENFFRTIRKALEMIRRKQKEEKDEL